jgi:hypothetical protein
LKKVKNFFGTDFTDATELIFFSLRKNRREKIVLLPEADRQGIGNHANPFQNSTVFIREIRAQKLALTNFPFLPKSIS